MKTLKASQIKSTTIKDAIIEVGHDHIDFANFVACRNNWAIGDAIEVIAVFIITKDEDYIIE